MKCQHCTETHAVKDCRTCGAPLCPIHRWGSGRESDGFYCVDSLCAPVHRTIHAVPIFSDPANAGTWTTLERPLAGPGIPFLYQFSAAVVVVIVLSDWKGFDSALPFLGLIVTWWLISWAIQRRKRVKWSRDVNFARLRSKQHDRDP